MTPTLYGRWQTRLFLMSLLGLPITLVFGLIFDDFRMPLILLGLVMLLGLGWDVLYSRLQVYRWERDWPPLLFALAALVEFVALWFVAQLLPFETLPAFWQMLTHYTTVWLITFCFMLGPIRVIFPTWRYNGARII